MTTQHLSPLTMLLSRHTRRREFITLLGGAAAACAARAQQPERSAASLYYRSGRKEPQRSASGEGQDRLKRSLMNSGSHPEAVLGPGAVARCSTTTRRSTSPFRWASRKAG